MSNIETDVKYKKMVTENREKNKAKEEIAINFIVSLKKTGKTMSVKEMAKQTGLSPSFFYKNKSVRKLVDSLAKKDQKIESIEIKKIAVINKANLKRIEVLEDIIKKQQNEIERWSSRYGDQL